jgi:hypothetical protein
VDGVNVIQTVVSHQFPRSGLADQGSEYIRFIDHGRQNSPTAGIPYFLYGISSRISVERIPPRH